MHLPDVTGKRKQKRSQYLSRNQLNSVMNTFMAVPEERPVSPITMSTSPVGKASQPDSHPLPLQPAQSPVQQAVQSAVQSPGLSPLHNSRPLLDPYEPLFAVEDDEDAKALEEIEGVIQLILDLTPRKESRPAGQRKRQKSEGVEVEYRQGNCHSPSCQKLLSYSADIGKMHMFEVAEV